MQRLRLSTYRQVWQLERVIYKIEGVRLPVAVTFRQVGLFLAAVLAMVTASRIPAVTVLPSTVRYVLIPSLITWYLTKQSLDGKPPHLWLRSVIRYWFGPRRLHRLRPAGSARSRVRLMASVFVRLRPRTERGIASVSSGE